MLSKLALRNAKRSMKDYMIYIVTMTIISTLMMGFNSMIFSKDIIALYRIAGIMAAIMGIMSVVVLIVVSWLIRYMIRFMMEKRSKEFGTYMILGMNKRQITKVFMRENLIMGGISFAAGILPAMFLQQMLTVIYYSIFEESYVIKLDFSLLSLLLSLGIYLVIYLFALWRVKRLMRKMTIREYMNTDKQNEAIPQNGTWIKRILFYIGCANILIFLIMLYQFRITIQNVLPLLILFTAGLYFIYYGLSAKIINQIQKRKSNIYRSSNLFLNRQFASKLSSMQFTMGTITVLFVFALIGCTIAMMFSQYQSKQVKNDLPFDAIIFSDDPDESFQSQKELLHKSVDVTDELIYRIYEDERDVVNQLMYSELPYFQEGGLLSREKDEEDTTNEFFDYDTYMRISDYNQLRRMLGYSPVELTDGQYLIHITKRTAEYMKDSFHDVRLTQQHLSYGGMYHEPFSQTGLNGADYVIVVPDETVGSMKPYYSLYAASFEQDAPMDLCERLKKMKQYEDEEENVHTRITWGYGSTQFISCQEFVLVKSNLIPEMKYVLTSISFPFIYVAVILLCVALTIMAVQQVSDASKYQFRYAILSKLGLKKCEIDRLILKQLAIYYLLPYAAASLVSGGVGLFLGKMLFLYTGLQDGWYWHYGKAFAVFSLIYLLYFIVTFHEFRRNVHSELVVH